MKNIIYFFDITVYTVHLISIIFSFIIYKKYKSKTLYYYLLTLIAVFLDISVEFVRIFFENIDNIGVPFKIIKFGVLFFEIYSISMLIYYFTNNKLNLIKKIFTGIIALLPIILVIIEIIYPNTDNFNKELFWINFIIHSIVIFYLIFIMINGNKNIKDGIKNKFKNQALIFLIISSPAYIIEEAWIPFKGFSFAYIPIFIWNIFNIFFIWKYYIFGTNKKDKIELFCLKYGLSSREKEIVTFIDNGFVNKEIAGFLSKSEASIKVSIHKIFKKCSVQNRVELINLLNEH